MQINVKQSHNYQGNYLVLGAGLLLFVIARLLVWIQFDFPADLYGGDSGYYIDVAKHIADIGTHISSSGSYAYRAPAYPYFLSIFFSMGVELTAVYIYIIQSLLLLLAYVAIFFMFRSKEGVAYKLAFLLLCLSPFDAIYNGRVLAENLLSPILLLSLAFLLSYPKRLIVGYILPGALLGVLTLTKDVFLLLPVFISIFILFRIGRIKYAFVFFLSYLFVVGPWVARNATLPTGEFIGISKGIMWSNLWVGSWMKDDILLSSAIESGFVDKEQRDLFKEKLKNKEQEQDFFQKQVVSSFLDRPLDVLSNWIYRIPKMWVGTRTDLFTMEYRTGSFLWYALKSAYFGANLIVLILFVTVLFREILNRDLDSYLFSTFIFYLLLVYMPFYNIETRYSQPVFAAMLLYLGLYGGAAFKRLQLVGR